MIRSLLMAVLALVIASPAAAADEFRVGYVRVMDDAQAMLA